MASRTWLRWALPATVLAVVWMSWWAWRSRPTSTLVARSSAGGVGATLSPPKAASSVVWRLLLNLDTSARPPGPEWVLHEGRQANEGYELHFLPRQLALQLYRTGDHLLLLGAVRLDRAPAEVALIRRGLRLQVAVDGALVLDCLDLLGSPPLGHWGVRAATTLGDATLSLYDDTRLVDWRERELASAEPAILAAAASDLTRPDHAIARARHAIALDPSQSPKRLAEARAAHHDAMTVLAVIDADHPQVPVLSAWLAWNRLRVALAGAAPETAEQEAILANGALRRQVDAATDGRRQAGRPDACPELPGLILDVLPRLAERACLLPKSPTAPKDVARARDAWLGLLGEAGMAALDASDPDYPPNLHWQLSLVVQAADCLMGRSPQPTPAEAPPWLTSRWRAFAGSNPFTGSSPPAARFPDLVPGWQERSPLTGTLDQLIAYAQFRPLPAVGMSAGMRAAYDQAGGRDASDQARSEAERRLTALTAEAPPRETALARAVLALSGLGDAGAAAKALAAADGTQPALAARDPLAFALDRLLALRSPRRGDPATLSVPPLVARVTLPAELAGFDKLLSGLPEATHHVWVGNLDALPPAQALAAALAMQEATGERADWSLLRRFPCFTIPLALLARPDPAHEPLRPLVDPPVATP